MNFELSRYDCLLSQNFLFVVIKDSASRYVLIILFFSFSEFSYNARSMGRCRHLRSVKRHPRNVILVFIFFFLSLIVYIFKNFSQIFADMSACLSDNKVIFTREIVLKFISSLSTIRDVLLLPCPAMILKTNVVKSLFVLEDPTFW